ncbi:hypothetical protein [Sphingobacterium sp. xlx-130]|uniref:hypothetical protein n=1 Tax=Sphingobacterium sp. xlx-130 TaxID=2654323 RepID=UPI0013DBFB5F|nr:hypothetical protein [Sphingobacterium sp. xlx-130]
MLSTNKYFIQREQIDESNVHSKNIPYIGPNLLLAPEAVIDDGLLDIVIVKEEQHEDFAAYIQKLLKGKTSVFPFKTLKTQIVNIDYAGSYMHIDDELMLPLREPMTIEVRKNILQLLM